MQLTTKVISSTHPIRTKLHDQLNIKGRINCRPMNLHFFVRSGLKSEPLCYLHLLRFINFTDKRRRSVLLPTKSENYVQMN